ncbi:MAG TPA: YihY/virulence factor BrkB family protein [Bacteroidia bacterium]|nr:YihY/virulence factor BrkB family protein [Bacteroidia bacterium]
MKFRVPQNQATSFISHTVSDFNADKVLKLAAALAFTTLFALPALLIIILWISSVFYSPSLLQDSMLTQLNGLLGKDAADQLREVLVHTKFDYTSLWAKVLGVVVLAISATGVFGEIQDSINTIWGLHTKPRSGFLKIFINRLLSFSIVVSLGFILIVSLVINALFASLSENIRALFPDIPLAAYYILNQLLMSVILVLLFGTIFKVLPDAKIGWRDILFGAVVTTLMFMGGKYVIEYILSHNATISMYGSAGSVIILLLWVYYSSIILYLGAEITQVRMKMKGRKIQPNRYSVWVEKKTIVVASNTDVVKEDEPVKEKPSDKVA